jgi:steroid 5-alpha reductase family enzyme
VVYAFAVSAGAGWWNVTLVGPVLLTLQFHGSTNFTEEITAGKYPAYATYQQRVSRLMPWPPRS